VYLTWLDTATTETAFHIERQTNGGVFLEVGIVGANVQNFTDGTVSEANNYVYRIRSANATFSGYSNTSAVTTPAPAPEAPTALTATAPAAAQLVWTDGSTNEVAFRIERAGTNGVFAEIATVGAGVTSYTDTTVLGSTVYTYRVRASNTGGFSAYSNTSTVTTPAVTTPPATPTGLSATGASSTQVHLVWTDASNIEAGLHIERAGSNGIYAEIAILGANATTYTDASVTAATAYTYRVRAINAAGFSAYSNVASLTTPAPNGSSVIKVMNFEVASLTDANTGADLVGGAGVALEPVAALKGNYSARISSTNSYLEETFGAATDFYGSFYLKFDSLPTSDVRLALISNGGVDIGEVQLRAAGNLRLRFFNTTTSVFVVVGSQSAALSPGTLYRVGFHQAAGSGANAVLEAWFATGETAFGAPFASMSNGTWTDGATRVRLGASSGVALAGLIDDVRLDSSSMPGGAVPAAPDAPTGLGASAPNATTVNLTWTDASTTETGFVLERAIGAGSYVELATLAANATTYVDTTVASTSYSYRLRAVNAGGFSAYSNVATVTTPAPPSAPPAAPTGLGATAPTASSVQLTWTDASTTETTFRIERAPNGGSFVEIATVAADVTAYTDNAVSPSTAYQYRVRAGNVAGNSDYSNTASVTTPADANVIKSMTFEDNALVHPTTGADSATQPQGGVSVDGASPIKGTKSVLFTTPAAPAGAYLQEDLPATTDLFVSFYFRATAAPGGDVRLVLLTNGAVDQAELQYRATGVLRVRVAGIVVGTQSAALTPGTIYRIGFHQKAGTGTNGVVEAYLAVGDAAFGAPFMSSTTQTYTDGVTRMRIGAATSVALNATLDDIKLNGASMPGPSN
ncbi:MAG: fibronectin type III domain-containing protein, partial [Vicinamibacterales bacterium]